MSTEDDDKPTVILDFNKLKEDLNQDEELLNDQEVDELFSSELESQIEEEHIAEVLGDNELSQDSKSIYLFCYKTDYFSQTESFKESTHKFKTLKTVEDLNQVLTTTDTPDTFIFYYNSAPKIINQLTAQIKIKFPNVNTVIIANNLSAQKAQQHSKSKYGANTYLSDPFELNELEQTLKSLN